MKSFKEKFYIHSDVAIAVIVLLIAGIIIGWRFNAVLNYSHTAGSESPLAENNTVIEAPVTPSTDQEPVDEDPVTPDIPSEDVWINGTLKEDMVLTLDGGSATAAVNSLISASLIDSYESYESICNTLGIDPLQIKAMTFEFPQGSTIEDIITQVTN